MLLRVLVRGLLDATSFERTKPERGHQLFRSFFIAPDLVLLALALLVSSEVLRSILAAHKIDTNYGEHYFDWFIILILIFLAILVSCLVLWHVHHEDERTLVLKLSSESRVRRDGSEYVATVRDIDWDASYHTRAFVNLIFLANVLAGICLIAYVEFIILGFLPRR